MSVSGKVASGERKVSLGLRLAVEEELGVAAAGAWCEWRWRRVIAAPAVDAEAGDADQGEPGPTAGPEETWSIVSSVHGVEG